MCTFPFSNPDSLHRVCDQDQSQMFQSLKAKAPRQTHTHTHFSHTYRNHRHTLSTHKTYTHTVRDMARGEKGGTVGGSAHYRKGVSGGCRASSERRRRGSLRDGGIGGGSYTRDVATAMAAVAGTGAAGSTGLSESRAVGTADSVGMADIAASGLGA